MGLGLAAGILACGPTVGPPAADGSSTGPVSTGSVSVGLDGSGSDAADGASSGGGDPGTDTATTTEGGEVSTSTGEVEPAVDRIVFFYYPDGVWQDDLFVESGSGFSLGSILADFAPYQAQMLIVTGFDNRTLDPADRTSSLPMHSAAPAALLTGMLGGVGIEQGPGLDDWYLGGATSIDQRIGESLGHPAVHLGVRTSHEAAPTTSPSWLMADVVAPAIAHPADALGALFDDPASPELADVAALVDAVPEVIDNDAVAVAMPAQVGIVRGLLRLDRARVVTLSFCRTACSVRMSWLGQTDDLHALGSYPNGPAVEQYSAAHAWLVGQLLPLVDELASTPTDDGGTALDHTLVVVLNDGGDNPPAHPLRDLSAVIIGNVSGQLRSGEVVHVDEASQADLAMTLAHVMGVDLDSFGHPALSAGVLTELLR